VVDEEGAGGRSIALTGDLVGRSGMGHAGLAATESSAAGGALAVVAVTGRLVGFAHHPILSITNAPTASSVRRGSILPRTIAGLARPGRARRSTHRASRRTVRSAGPRPTDPAPSAWPPSRCPPGRACTGRSFRPRRTASG